MTIANEVAGRHPFTVINTLLAECQTLLDVGAGTGQTLSVIEVPFKLGLDIHRPYLEHWPPMPGITVPLHLAAGRLPKVFLPKSVDAVTFIDSLEHLTPPDARAVLTAAEVIARRVVIVFTPRGPFAQQGFDAWGLGGERFQQHRSEWQPETFAELSYDVLIFAGFHDVGNESFVRAFGPDAPPIDALLAYKRINE